MPNAWHLTRDAPSWQESDARLAQVAAWLLHALLLFYALQYMLASLLSGILECGGGIRRAGEKSSRC